MSEHFTRTQDIYTYDCDVTQHAKPTAVLNYFQQLALEHSSSLKAGPYELAPLHLAWFIVKYHVEFKAYPKFLDTVTIGTWASAFRGFTAHRGFSLEDKDGNLMVDGKSHWMMMNHEAGHIVRIADEPINAAYGVDETGPRFKMARFKKLKDWQSETVFPVYPLDIDYNGHLNNVKYVDHALNALPAGTFEDNEVATLDIIYKEQAFLGEVLTARVAQDAKAHYQVDIANADDMVLCQVGVGLREKASI